MAKITVYTKCGTCGIEGARIKQLLKVHPDAKVIKTSDRTIERQTVLMERFHLPMTHYYGLVVYEDDNGKVVKVIQLTDWRTNVIG